MSRTTDDKRGMSRSRRTGGCAHSARQILASHEVTEGSLRGCPHAKNRRTARIPLQLETVAVLRRFLVGALPATLVFRDAHRGYRAAEVLRWDLEAAGIPERTEAGRVDFHSLRVSFVTNMARAHVPLAQAQKLARHCSPVLTSTIYSRFGFDEDAAAIAKLPSLTDAAG